MVYLSGHDGTRIRQDNLIIWVRIFILTRKVECIGLKKETIDFIYSRIFSNESSYVLLEEKYVQVFSTSLNFINHVLSVI